MFCLVRVGFLLMAPAALLACAPGAAFPTPDGHDAGPTATGMANVGGSDTADGAPRVPRSELTAEQNAVIQLGNSRALFLDLKQRRGPDYGYVSSDTWSGGLGGHDDRTELDIHNDRVVQRRFWSDSRYRSYPAAPDWAETDAAVGSHYDRHAAPALTIERLHVVCEANVLSKPRSDFDVVLDFGADHIITKCSYRPKNCADDCTIGYDITSIQWPRP
jgi:hypothetical protein